jgi:hypothetical protein
MTGSGTFHQADEEQSDSSMMALHVHEFGRRNTAVGHEASDPSVMKLCR